MVTKIGVISTSIRKDSLGKRVFNNIKNNQKELEKVNNVELHFLDLKTYHLPFFDEPFPPMMGKNPAPTGTVKEWLDDLQAVDGYLIIEAVYNHSLPGVWKNAIDFISSEISGKPAHVISYSLKTNGGEAAALALYSIVNILGMIVLPTESTLNDILNNLNPDGSYTKDAPDKNYFQKTINNALKDVTNYATILKNAKN